MMTVFALVRTLETAQRTEENSLSTDVIKQAGQHVRRLPSQAWLLLFTPLSNPPLECGRNHNVLLTTRTSQLTAYHSVMDYKDPDFCPASRVSASPALMRQAAMAEGYMARGLRMVCGQQSLRNSGRQLKRNQILLTTLSVNLKADPSPLKPSEENLTQLTSWLQSRKKTSNRGPG